MVSEINKYIVSFFFDDKGLKLSLLNEYSFVFVFLFYFVFLIFCSWVKDQHETQNSNSNFELTNRFRKPRSN